jgi:hypothetical protein
MAQEKEKASEKTQQSQTPTPGAAGELADADLEKVAGGEYEPYTSVYSCSGTSCHKLE